MLIASLFGLRTATLLSEILFAPQSDPLGSSRTSAKRAPQKRRRIKSLYCSTVFKLQDLLLDRRAIRFECLVAGGISGERSGTRFLSGAEISLALSLGQWYASEMRADLIAQSKKDPFNDGSFFSGL